MKGKIKITIAAVLGVALLATGCSGTSDETTAGETTSSATSAATTASGTTSETVSSTDYFTDRDFEIGYDESSSVYITLNGDSAEADEGAEGVTISGSTVTITAAGVYVLSGTLDDGMIIIEAGSEDKIQLVLNGVDITSSESAPIYVKQADKVFITLESGTENTLTNGGTFTAIDENNIDAVIFSKDDLTINGSGSLTITSPAGHGIVSKDDLKVTGGTITITAANTGLRSNDALCLTNANITISSGTDGVHAENDDDASVGYIYIESGTYYITAEGDGISASGFLFIEDGVFDIAAGGGSENGSSESSDSWGNFPGSSSGGRGGTMPGMGGTGSTDDGSSEVAALSSTSSTSSSDDSTSMKGMKAGDVIIIDGGTFVIDSADDSVHGNSSVTINGGSFEIASGDDAMHAEEELTINGGTITITESYEGLEGCDVYITDGEIDITASDDGINAAGGNDSSGFGGRGNDMFGSSDNTVEISGGTINIAAGGDGIDSNGTLVMSGGTVYVFNPTSGDTSILDYGSTGTITGGTFVGTGASSMLVTFNGDNEQAVITVTGANASAGTELTLTDSDGNVIVSATPVNSYQAVIISTPELVSGESYTLTIGSESAEVTAY